MSDPEPEDGASSGTSDEDATSRDVPSPASAPPKAPVAAPAEPTAALTDLEALDQESPTQALKVLGVLAIIATLVLLIPRQFVSAAITFALGVSLLLAHRVRLRRSGRTG